jgi:hypothetical protein
MTSGSSELELVPFQFLLRRDNPSPGTATVWVSTPSNDHGPSRANALPQPGHGETNLRACIIKGLLHNYRCPVVVAPLRRSRVAAEKAWADANSELVQAA